MKNVWYRYFKWDNNSQFFLAREITKEEVESIIKDVLSNRKVLLTDHDLRRFKEFGANRSLIKMADDGHVTGVQ